MRLNNYIVGLSLLCTSALLVVACDSKKGNSSGATFNTEVAPSNTPEQPTNPEESTKQEVIDPAEEANKLVAKPDGQVAWEKRVAETYRLHFETRMAAKKLQEEQEVRTQLAASVRAKGTFDPNFHTTESNSINNSGIHDGELAFIERLKTKSQQNPLVMYGDLTEKGLKPYRHSQYFNCREIVEHPDRTTTPDPQVYACCSTPNYFGYKISQLYEDPKQANTYQCLTDRNAMGVEFCSIWVNDDCKTLKTEKAESALNDFTASADLTTKNGELILKGINENPMGLIVSLNQTDSEIIRLSNTSRISNSKTQYWSNGHYNIPGSSMKIASQQDFSYVIGQAGFEYSVDFHYSNTELAETKDLLVKVIENKKAFEDRIKEFNSSAREVHEDYVIEKVKFIDPRFVTVDSISLKDAKGVLEDNTLWVYATLESFDNLFTKSNLYFWHLAMPNEFFDSRELSYRLRKDHKEVTVEVKYARNEDSSKNEDFYQISISTRGMIHAEKVQKFKVRINGQFKIFARKFKGVYVNFRYEDGLKDRVNFHLDSGLCGFLNNSSTEQSSCKGLANRPFKGTINYFELK